MSATLSERLLWALVSAMCIPSLAVAEGLEMESPYIKKHHSPFQSVPYRNPLSSDSAAILDVETELFSDHEDIDFEKRQVTFSKVDTLGFKFWVYHYGELSDYLFNGMRYSLYQGWYDDVANAQRAKTRALTRSTLDFALPIQYPKWAQRVLGKEPPKLSIDGHLKLIVSYDNTRQEPPNSTGIDESQGIQFNQEYSFTVRGSIGRALDISIKAGSEEDFNMDNFGNQLKNFKIEYRGEQDELEDEIIQEIVAGYTGFEMPGQGLAGYSESHEGLFGIKIRSQFGPLTLTTIASNEQGESQELELSRGSSSGMTALTEKDIERYRFFFLDTVYRRHYINKYAELATDDSVPEVLHVEIWKREDVVAGTRDITKTYRGAKISGDRSLTFRRLAQAEEYYLNEQEGWILLSDSIAMRESDILACVLRTSQPSVVPDKGDTALTDDTTGGLPVMRELALLKDEYPDTSQPSHALAWPNVYRMPKSVDPAEFDITVTYKVGGTDTVGYFHGKEISSILGLTDPEDGKPYITNGDIYRTGLSATSAGDGYLVMPPFADSLIGNQPFRNPALGDSAIEEIYTKRYDLLSREYTSRYTITMTGTVQGKQDRIDNLGWGVIKGSEKVIADGTPLVRDVDYIIDYEMGTITLTSEKALAANNVKVKYEREALFVPEKKVFLGAHGRVDLPFLGDKAFVGATIMWQNASTNERTPRLGQEPFERLLLDVNTSMEFEPEWMTKLFRWMPSVRPEAESKVSFDVEVAHSRMQPNSSDNGAAFIDDFEGSRQAFGLGNTDLTWRQASPPWQWVLQDTTVNNESVGKFLYHPPAWNSYWFNPVDSDTINRVYRLNIWDDSSLIEGAGAQHYERVLWLHCTPAPTERDSHYVHPWAGIMTYLPASFVDRSRDKYFTFVAKSDGGGKLAIDFGTIAEQISIDGGPPNTKEDTEDSSHVYEPNAKLDVGLDRRVDSLSRADTLNRDPDYEAEYRLMPNITTQSWDSLWYKDDLLPYPRDPSGDNWKEYNKDNLDNYPFVNGLEGNGGTLNTEDINYDGDYVSTARESFFRAEIDLDSLRKYIAHYANLKKKVDALEAGGGADPATKRQLEDTTKFLAKRFFIDLSKNVKCQNGWYQFRIPIRDESKVVPVRSPNGKEPSWRQIRSVRVLWDGFSPEEKVRKNKVAFTGFQFVGNQWQEAATSVEDSVQNVKIEASSVNNDENPEYSSSVITGGLAHRFWEYDANSNPKREHALELSFHSLFQGENAFVDRLYTYRSFDVTGYEHVGLYVHSDRDQRSDRVRFILRFGTDSLTYYEYRSDVLDEGWEELGFALRDFAQLKLAYLNAHGEDSVGLVDTISADGHLRLHAEAGRLPTFSNITWMALGVMRDSSSGGDDSVSGVIWVNNMRVMGSRSLNGWAARVALSTTWADFMQLSFNSEYTDADFRTMTQELHTSGSSELRAAVDMSWRLDKFLPADWGVTVPFGTTISSSLSRPLKKPNTDIYLTDAGGSADRLPEMFADALGVFTNREGDGHKTAAEHYQSIQRTQTWYTKYEKAAKSNIPVTKMTAERIKANYSFTDDFRSQARGEKPDGNDYVDTTNSTTYAGKLSYDLSPRDPPKWTKWRPLDRVEWPWLPEALKRYELSLLPSTLNFQLADIRYVRKLTYDAKADRRLSTRTFDLGHGFDLRYEPLSPLVSLDYGLTVGRGLDEGLERGDASDAWAERWGGFLTREVFSWHIDDNWANYYLLRGEENRTQRLALAFKPQIFGWLTHDFDYSADYSAQLASWKNDPRDYYNMSVATTFGFRSTLSIARMFGGLSERTEKIAGLSKTFGLFETGLGKIGLNSFTLSYDAGSDLKNNRVGTDYLNAVGSSFDFLTYTVGKEGRALSDIMTGNMDDERAYGGVRNRAAYGDVWERYKDDLRTTSQSLSLSTSLNLPDPVAINISPLSIEWTRRYSVKPDTAWYDTSITWPRFRAGASSRILNQLGFVKKYMDNVSLKSNYRFEKTLNVRSQSKSDTTLNHALEPLIKVDGRLKKQPITIRYEHGYTNQKSMSEDLTQTKRHTDDISIDYKIPKARKERVIKIFKWSIPIRGRFTVGAKLGRSHELQWENLPQKEGGGHPEPHEDDADQETKLTLVPSMKYDFTDNVDATLQYEGSRTEEQPADVVVHSHLFSLSVDIRF